MQGFKKLDLLQLIFLMKIFFPASLLSQEIPLSYCGSIKIHQNASYSSSLLSHMILCKSDQLYFRTSIGLFQISSIDYKNKLLTVSHSSCSSMSDFVSPLHLSAGFPPPSSPNSLLLFNCSNQSSTVLFSPCNNTQNQALAKEFSCSFIDDVRKLQRSFDPQQMNCTHYSRVYRSSEKFELGTRISFDIPDHVPNPCDQCKKPDGNCGAGLRCVCHPKSCRDKVVSVGADRRPGGNILFCLVFFIVIVEILQRS